MTEQTETPTPPPTPPETPVAKDPQQEAQQWAMFCHLGSLAHLVGIPFAGLVLPIILWQSKKDTHPFIDEQGKEVVNFQLTVLLAVLICIPLCFVCVGFILLGVIGILDIVLTILAALAASKGEHYRYPLCIRFIK